MCMFAVAMIDIMAEAMHNKLERKLSLTEFEEIIYRYSRETEHSDDNIGILLEYFDAEC